MAITLAAVVIVLLILYFVRETGRDQELEIPFSTAYRPGRTTMETQLDIPVPPEIIWKTLTSPRDYHLWFPWIRRVRVTNKNVSRWAHRHSFLHYTLEVGSRFKIRPFPFSPPTSCRFISLDPPNSLSIEMRFFPAVREIVTFTLTPYANLVEANYRSVCPSVLGFIPQALFSWRGRKVLHNLHGRLPDVPYVEEKPQEVPEKEEKPVVNESQIREIVARAFKEGKEVLDGISDRSLRAKAKSAYIKAERSGEIPQVEEKAAPAEQEAPSEEAPPEKELEDDQEAVIQKAVAEALDGNMDAINNISDRVLRGKAKAAHIKAKRKKS